MPDKTVFDHIAAKVLDEAKTAGTNMRHDIDDFEGAIDLIENVRTEKDYDWMSNVALPNYASMSQTQISMDAATYFQTRDFVEVYIEGEDDESIEAAKANKVLINKTLNRRDMYHYPKYIRAKLICNNFKNVVARCFWEQETVNKKTGTVPHTYESQAVDINDEPLLYEGQIPKTEVFMKDVHEDVPIKDGFNWDVIDPRNVFYDNTYAYSLQDKKWVTILYSRTLAQLRAEEEDFGYINLDKLEKVPPPIEPESTKRSSNKEEDWVLAGKNFEFDIYERHGLEWCIVNEEDENGNPTKIDYGYDENGNVLDEAEQRELILTVAVSNSHSVLIRYTPQKYMDYNDKPYRPLIRGINYIHPSKDGGIGDAQYGREIQKFINDTVNMSNDRVKLATLPTLKGNKDALADNETVYFAPEHVIELWDTKDLEEFTIQSDISGAMQMIGMGVQGLQQVMAIFPTTQGDLPENSSTTATAIAGAEERTNARTSYRSLTWEYTFLSDLYWMMTQMTYQFAFESTALKLFGDRETLLAFRPDYEFFYKPVTGAIETEYSKGVKIKENISLIQSLVSLVGINEGAPQAINMLMSDIFELRGAEKKKYADFLLNPQSLMKEGNAGINTPSPQGPAVSNQNQIPMSGIETETRGI